MTTVRMSSSLARGLGVRLEHDVPQGDYLNQKTPDVYVEKDPTPAEWVKETLPGRRQIFGYFYNLFPFLQWIARYNMQYFYGDVVAGITVGAVLVPESTAYARLAGLSPEFGLYSGVVGTLTYWIFATSKDISIGPIAVMSAITGKIVSAATRSHPEIPPHVVASSIAVVAGAIIAGLGLLRLGFLVELIPLPSIHAFMTGAALNIIAGQLPSLLGVPHHPSKDLEPFVNTGDATYLVFVDTLKSLNEARVDAALGLTALVTLYSVRFFATKASQKYPSQKKLFFFINTLRITFVILVYTMVSWLVNRNRRKTPMFNILGPVPRGFQHLAVPTVSPAIISSFANKLPVAVIVLLLEHIACAKSFARVNNYTIQPSQELLANGVANMFGAFFGGFAVTGSFTRSAINSKAGVRTPLAGVAVTFVLVLSIYALTTVFFYFPTSVLSAIIIHAVGDLITLPEESYRIWRISPIDFIIYSAGILLSVFTSVEIGIYVTVSISAGVLGFRLIKAPGRFLGKVKIGSTTDRNLTFRRYPTSSSSSLSRLLLPEKAEEDGVDDLAERNLFLPLDHEDGSNPEIILEVPYPGIFMYRFSESFNYPNASRYLNQLLQTIYLHTERTNPNSYKRPGDRPWNAPSRKPDDDSPEKPHLKTIILDFSAVNNVDSTSVSALHDLRNQLDQYTSPYSVSWHFASINNRWTKRALTAAGFGYDRSIGFSAQEEAYREHGLRPIYNISNIEEDDLLGRETDIHTLVEDASSGEKNHLSPSEKDSMRKKEIESQEVEIQENSGASSLEDGDEKGKGKETVNGSDVNIVTTLKVDQMEKLMRSEEMRLKRKKLVVTGVERPFFHVDLTSALQSAIAELRHREMVADRDTGILP